MHPFRLLGHYTLALIAVSTGESTTPAPSLSDELHTYAGLVMNQPRYRGDHYFPSQQLAKMFEAMMGLIIDRLFKDVNDHADVQAILGALVPSSIIMDSEPYTTSDYARRHQDQAVLFELCEAYVWTLRPLETIVRIWGEAAFGLSDALAEFLKSGIEARRVCIDCRLYFENLLHHIPALFEFEREKGTIPPTIKDEKEFKEMVDADCLELTTGLAGLFDRMAERLGDLVEALGGPHRADAWKCLVSYLYGSFTALTYPLSVAMRPPVEIISEDRPWEEPWEVLASARIRIVCEILEFKLEFPELGDHIITTAYLSRNECSIIHENGPALIEERFIRDKLESNAPCLYRGADFAELRDNFKHRLESLKGYVFGLYLTLASSEDRPHPVLDGRIRGWLESVERNISFLLETIRLNGDERRRRCILGMLIIDLEPIAFNVESVLSRLYTREQLGRREGEPGHLLAKLRQVSREVGPLHKPSGLKSARTTREPETRPK